MFYTILEAKESKREIVVLLYDLSAAFDTVPHKILIDKLKLYDFDNDALYWMKSYLRDKKQIVDISNKESTAKNINIGTPQGSKLSPLLFIILMADMDLWTRGSMLSNFADDT